LKDFVCFCIGMPNNCRIHALSNRSQLLLGLEKFSSRGKINIGHKLCGLLQHVTIKAQFIGSLDLGDAEFDHAVICISQHLFPVPQNLQNCGKR